MDYDAIGAGLQQAIPFNTHVGLEVLEIRPGVGVVHLPDDERLRNHVGSQHAAALFAVGELASGGAFVGAFVEHMGGLTPLAESATIAYKRLARGPITATGTLTGDRDELLAELDQEGVVRFPVEVELADAEGTVVATMTVNWHVKRNA